MTCGRCGNDYQGVKCACGWMPKSVREEDRIDPAVNRCEVGSCGVPASIGPLQGMHLPKRCPWHQHVERIPAENTFAHFQLWRKSRVVHSVLSDQTVWDALQGARQLTYRGV